MEKHILSFPRMGVGRELEFALEQYWKGLLPEEQLHACGRSLRQKHSRIRLEAGLTRGVTNDFSWYDHVLDMTVMLNAVPDRFRELPAGDAATYFTMAR
ncbi:MAG: hypothetical protein GX937_15990 [Lentisphaerae bacterium]|jgi:5-methyltetrahydropteroyltriglutamate--homocysteine methyltransferase|nr:hypothetical protein [Lentisphaerota bacterium]